MITQKYICTNVPIYDIKYFPITIKIEIYWWEINLSNSQINLNVQKIYAKT